MKASKYIPIFITGAGIAILGYYWKVLGDRGMAADASGTAGYTTNLEIAAVALGAVLVILGLVMLLRVRKK